MEAPPRGARFSRRPARFSRRPARFSRRPTRFSGQPPPSDVLRHALVSPSPVSAGTALHAPSGQTRFCFVCLVDLIVSCASFCLSFSFLGVSVDLLAAFLRRFQGSMIRGKEPVWALASASRVQIPLVLPLTSSHLRSPKLSQVPSFLILKFGHDTKAVTNCAFGDHVGPCRAQRSTSAVSGTCYCHFLHQLTIPIVIQCLSALLCTSYVSSV